MRKKRGRTGLTLLLVLNLLLWENVATVKHRKSSFPQSQHEIFFEEIGM